VGYVLVGVGLLLNFVFGVWIVVQAFRVSVGWGLAVMFLPFAGLFFVVNHWQETKTPFLGGIASGVLMVLGVFIVPTPDPAASAAETSVASRSTASDDDDDEDAPAANYASAAAPVPPSYEPARNVYQPPTTYTPAYNPPTQPVPAVATDTQAIEDEWARKPMLEQVYVDRETNTFYVEKCKKRPENVYRIPRSVAVMQGYTEAQCK